MMKITKKVTKLRLEVRQPDEYILKGLVSAEPDYKISLLLNKKLKISLKNTEPLSVGDEHEKVSLFSRFISLQNNSEITYMLVSNRNGSKDHLLKKFRNIDYILIVHDPENIIKQEELSARLRETESITAVFSIDPLVTKDKYLGYLIH